MSEIRPMEFCREWLENPGDTVTGYCNAPADFILWGKLLAPEALGPRCYDHAAAHVGDKALTPGANFALFDLRTVVLASPTEERSE